MIQHRGSFASYHSFMEEHQDPTFRSDFTVDLVDKMGTDDSVLRAMLVSTLSDGRVDGMDDTAKVGRIKSLMKGKHGTPFEHTAITFRSEAPIFVYREWHRHRVGVSINEQSGRYTKFEPVFYIPPPLRPLVQVGKKMEYRFEDGGSELHDWLVEDMKMQAHHQWASYEHRIAKGIALEVARMSLGVNIYSSMFWTCNLRSLMAFLSLRTRSEPFWQEHKIDGWGSSLYEQVPGGAMFPSGPQWEIEQSARLMEDIFAEHFPMTYAAYNELGRVAP